MPAKRSINVITSEFKRLSTRTEKNDILARYKLGGLVNEMHRSYGTGGMNEMAAKVGKSKSLLYTYAAVYRSWTRAELETLLARSKGAVAWAHLVVLASGWVNKRDRNVYLSNVIKHNLSAMDLSSEVWRSRTSGESRSNQRMKWNFHATLSESSKILRVKGAIALFYADSEAPSNGEFLYQAAELMLTRLRRLRAA